MELATAINLTQHGVDQSYPQRWMDLGAGAGLFTMALSSLLHSGSSVLAVDRDGWSMQKLTTQKATVAIEKMEADFLTMEFQHSAYNGVMMANSLHFASDKATLLFQIQQTLLPGGRIIIIEYDMDHPNQWVPFPISLDSLNQLLRSLSFPSAVKLSEVPSVYQRANIYSAVITF